MDQRQPFQAELPSRAHLTSNQANDFSKCLDFSTGVDITESELLLYCLLVEAFPLNSFRARYHEKYLGISSAIENVLHVDFGSVGIANYLYRANNNLRRDLGKVKGVLRWKCYREKIERIVKNHPLALQALISSRDSTMETSGITLNELRNQLTRECSKERMGENAEEEEAVSETKFSIEALDTLNIDEFPNWKKCVNSENNTAHLFYYGGKSIGYPQIEVAINNEGFWKIRHEGRERKICLDWADVSPQINSIQDLDKLLITIQSLKVCPGCSFEQFQTVLPHNNSEPVYYMRNGEPAAFVEVNPSQYHKKSIRSTSCLIFIPYDEALLQPANEICAACGHSQHYLRTLKSRIYCQNQIGEKHKGENSKYTRFDYLDKDDLMHLLREKTTEMKNLQKKVKKLEKCREKMVEVGRDTDSDFRVMFKKLNDGLRKQKENPKSCKWKGCSEQQNWTEADELYQHVKGHIKVTDDLIAPIERNYSCLWGTCDKTFSKKKILEEHLREHTGFSRDQFFPVLLNDQAKALTVPKRQMRWHPLVIKWCLRMFSKSHAAYDDLRESGFLNLPSGRLLSDYKNLSSPLSGWQTSTLDEMKLKFEKVKIGKRGQLGGLFFDEVKIKEGLVFNPSTFELVGFTDLDDDEIELPSIGQLKESDSKPENKLATHVLQFYFPCAFFLTRGVTAQKLNRLFWQGVSILHGFNFTIMLACCDGAPENRAFMNMNGNNASKSKCYNPFSRKPLFFISDPPHLLKKLRNNIYTSGFKCQNSRFTRLLQKNGKYILWDHIYSVYQRDKQRRLYATDLRNAHVHLDNLSKMRVKLAVHTLSEKVCRDMALHENNSTEKTQEFIKMCEMLWNVFNDNSPLQSITDQRITNLNQVLNYFKAWKQELQQVFHRRTDVSQHFITWQTMFDLEVI